MDYEKEIKKALETFGETAKKALYDEITESLTRLGEECVARIRLRGKDESWIDHTGNLRSSIGMAVYADGELMAKSAFQQVSAPEGDGTQGKETGEKMIQDIAKSYGKSVALVIVAGMEYASYVEAIESKDVLESTKHWAMGIVNQRLNEAVDICIDKMNRGIFD